MLFDVASTCRKLLKNGGLLQGKYAYYRLCKAGMDWGPGRGNLWLRKIFFATRSASALICSPRSASRVAWLSSLDGCGVHAKSHAVK